MEKIAINPNRLKWCCETLGMDVDSLHQEVDIAQKTVVQAMQAKEVLSIKQLEKIAHFFNRSLLFFLNPNEVQVEKIYSTQFRTINNQKPLHSRQINALIELVEQHRQAYLDLLENLDKLTIDNWYPSHLDLIRQDIKRTTMVVRQWLGVSDNLTFDKLRALVEAKGIMVFVTNGYNGQWQISKKSSVRGFALYYDTLPIIVIKKQNSDGAKAFTLMHELAHLLLHKDSVLDEEADFYLYQGREKEANEFASSVLITDEALKSIDLERLQGLEIEAHDDYLTSFKNRWCVSGDAILYRLFRERKIAKVHYQAYRDFKDEQYKKKEAEEERAKQQPNYRPPVRKYRHREPLHIFGKTYVATVLDAQQNNNITLTKASTYLDNLKIHALHKLENDFVSS